MQNLAYFEGNDDANISLKMWRNWPLGC